MNLLEIVLASASFTIFFSWDLRLRVSLVVDMLVAEVVLFLVLVFRLRGTREVVGDSSDVEFRGTEFNAGGASALRFPFLSKGCIRVTATLTDGAGGWNA